ncbi:MAG: NAD(P)H-dependent oxidoreductase subunit E [Patescibacteria group bacterium]
MGEVEEKKKSIATIKVCVNDKCKSKGSEDIYQNLKEGLSPDEAVVLKISECFGYCDKGPNIAINDNIVSGVKPFLAVETVLQELDNPSCKADGLGSKSLDDLDSVLDDITKL